MVVGGVGRVFGKVVSPDASCRRDGSMGAGEVSRALSRSRMRSILEGARAHVTAERGPRGESMGGFRADGRG